MPTTIARPAKALAFLRQVWQDDGYHVLCLGRKDIDPKPAIRERWFKLPDDWDALRSYVNDPATAGYDVYHCPTSFAQSKRLKAFANPVRWVWGDLDDADPRNLPDDTPPPSLVIESSPNRWQALWCLQHPAAPADIEAINRGLAYTLDFDKSGWDIGQLLRVPGFGNRKYSNHPPVVHRRTLSRPDAIYRLSDFTNYRMALASDTPTDAEQARVVERATKLNVYGLREQYRSHLPGRTNQLLDAPNTNLEHDRSARLWELECALFEFEFKPHEVFALVRETVWNKFRGEARENTQLVAEVMKAYSKITAKLQVIAAQSLPEEETSDSDLDAILDEEPQGGVYVEGEEPEEEPIPWVVTSFREWIETPRPPPRFLVEGLLPEQEPLGVLGASKTLKSFFLYDLGVSIASGHPCFNRFTVNEPMPVLYIQQEINESGSQERGRRITTNKGLTDFGTMTVRRDIPFYLIEMQGVSLARERDRVFLERLIRQLGIRVLIIDPWYLSIAPADENSSREVAEIWSWATTVQRRFTCQMILVHHLTKLAAMGEGPGGALGARGTGAFGNYLANTITITVDPKDDLLVYYERKFRLHPAPGPMAVRFELDANGGSVYVPHVDDSTLEQRTQALKKMKTLMERTRPNEPVAIAEIVRKLKTTDAHVAAYVQILVAEDYLQITNQRLRGIRTPSVVRTIKDPDAELDDL